VKHPSVYNSKTKRTGDLQAMQHASIVVLAWSCIDATSSSQQSDCIYTFSVTIQNTELKIMQVAYTCMQGVNIGKVPACRASMIICGQHASIVLPQLYTTCRYLTGFYTCTKLQCSVTEVQRWEQNRSITYDTAAFQLMAKMSFSRLLADCKLVTKTVVCK